MDTNFWSTVGSIASAITAAIAFFTAIIASQSAKYTSQQALLLQEQINSIRGSALVDIHSRFQSEIRNIQRNFPARVSDPSWVPNEVEDRNISLYWYLVFDEWLTCTQMNKELDRLWSKHYSEGVKSALRLPAFKKKIEEIFQGDAAFLGYGENFKKEIETLCFAGTGKSLRY